MPARTKKRTPSRTATGRRRSSSRRAYVTMISGGDTYVPGLEALGRSLAETRTKVPRIAMVTADVDADAREQLTTQGWELHPVEPIENPHADEALLYARFAATFTKLRVFDLDDFAKVVFLDADTVVLRNVDELFERPAIAAAPDFFMPDRFNSGVMVIEPSHELFAKLHASLLSAPSYDGGDQGVLNAYWPDWWSMPAGHRLEARYNMHHFVFQFMTAHESVRRQFIDEIKIVHYTLQKPWKGFTMTGGSEVWWDKYYAAHPEKAGKLRRSLHALQDWSFDSVVNLLGGS